MISTFALTKIALMQLVSFAAATASSMSDLETRDANNFLFQQTPTLCSVRVNCKK